MVQPAAGRFHAGHALRLAGAMLVAAISLVGARIAAAQAEPTARALAWHAPSGCPTEAQVVADVARTLAGSGAELTPFVAVVDVRGPTGGRWQASLLFQAGDTRAERQFEAESCEAIASASALVVALWAEGGAGAPSPNATAPAPVEPPPAEAPRVPAITATPRSDSETPGFDPEKPRFVLMVNAVFDRHTMPDAPATGIEVAGGPVWKGRGWRFRALAGLSFFPSAQSSTDFGRPAGDFWLLDLSTRGCLTFLLDRFELGPCAGAALAVMDGTAMNTGSFQYPTQLWLSLMGGAAIAWRVSQTAAVFARGEVVVPTTRRSWNTPSSGDGVMEGYEIPSYGGRGALGIELRFW
jgi:hypothetical protein